MWAYPPFLGLTPTLLLPHRNRTPRRRHLHRRPAAHRTPHRLGTPFGIHLHRPAVIIPHFALLRRRHQIPAERQVSMDLELGTVRLGFLL